jgi:heme-degrading monooxygenase HmoA
MNGQQQKVMELVVFKLNPKEDIAVFQGAAAKMTHLLKDEVPGFIERSLLHTAEKDQWVDVVYWSTMEHALAAIDVLKSKEEFQSFVSKIDMQQTSTYHLMPIAL